MSPTLHTALEPMAFRGLLQDKEREVLHSGPGGGTYHLYEGGVQAVLGQYQGGRAGYRDGALAGTGAGVLRDGGRGERQVFEPITLTTYATMSYIPKFQIGNETVTIFRRWACPTLTAVCLPNFRVQR